jgi:hypothetical protein
MNRRYFLRCLGVGGLSGLAGCGRSRRTTPQVANSPETVAPASLPTSKRSNIAATDGDADDRFGLSVAVSGDGTTAIVGARGDEDPNVDGAGSAYVFA